MDPPRANAIHDRMTTSSRSLLLLAALALGSSCSGDAKEALALPMEVAVAAPTEPIAIMSVVEDYSEEVANRFV